VLLAFPAEPPAALVQAQAIKRATLVELIDYLARNRAACAKEIYEPAFRLVCPAHARPLGATPWHGRSNSTFSCAVCDQRVPNAAAQPVACVGRV
jgi:hypothetical protein